MSEGKIPGGYETWLDVVTDPEVPFHITTGEIVLARSELAALREETKPVGTYILAEGMDPPYTTAREEAAWLRKAADQENEALRERVREAGDLKGILATTADRLNTALRENGMGEILGDPYRSLAIRDGIVDLYDRGAQYRTERDAARAEVERLRSDLKSAYEAADRYAEERNALRAALRGEGEHA